MHLALLAALLAAPLVVEVHVPLCDSALIACGRGALGDPRSLEGNLYWGARYGAEQFLSREPGFRVLSRAAGAGAVLREVTLVRAPGPGEREVRLLLRAWAGDRIDEALAAFLAAAGGASSADLVVWAGHDRLMDVAAPSLQPGASPRPVAVLACASQAFFGPPLRALGARPVALTRTLMAPEAYLLAALAGSLAAHGVDDPAAHRRALAAAYARYQRIGPEAASSVFARLP